MTAYHIRALARGDLESIWDYTVAEWNVEQAERYLGQLFSCFDDLAANPALGRQRDELLPGMRSFPQGKHIIFYEVGSQIIEIIAIVHQGADVIRYFDSDG